jgi:RimJ/RimL family protein N-acetyltransferase
LPLSLDTPVFDGHLVSLRADNDRSLAFHRQLGFVAEGRRRRAIYTAGAHHDLHLLGMTAEEFWATVAS